MSCHVGIDIGTNKCALAVRTEEGVRVIRMPSGDLYLPSVIAVTQYGDVLVGRSAYEYWLQKPEQVLVNSHGCLDENQPIQIADRTITPVGLVSLLVAELRHVLSEVLEDEPHEIALAVPACATDQYRRHLCEAVELSGLMVDKCVPVPVAISTSLGIGQQRRENVLIASYGAGQFDVGVVRADGHDIRLIGACHPNQLGARLLDQAIVDYLLNIIRDRHGYIPERDPWALAQLTRQVRLAKPLLAKLQSARIRIPYLSATKSGPVNFDTVITMPDYYQVAYPVFNRMRAPLVQALVAAGLKPAQLDRVVLTGGAGRMPLLAEMVRQTLGHQPELGASPLSAVAVGSALQGDHKKNRSVAWEMNPMGLGVVTNGNKFTVVVPKNTTLPASCTYSFTTVEDRQSSVELHIVQGEGPTVAECVSLGRFKVMGITPAPAGKPHIEVVFQVSQSGQVEITAGERNRSARNGVTLQIGDWARHRWQQKSRTKSPSGMHDQTVRITTLLNKARQLMGVCCVAERSLLEDAMNQVIGSMRQESIHELGMAVIFLQDLMEELAA